MSPSQTLVPPGPPWPLLARAFSLWPPEGQRAPDKRTLSLSAYELRLSSGETGSSQGPREQPPLHVQTTTENVLDRDTAVEQWSQKETICHSNGHFYGLGEFDRRPAATSQTIHVRAPLSQSERQMYHFSYYSRLGLSDWWAELQQHEGLAHQNQSHLCSCLVRRADELMIATM